MRTVGRRKSDKIQWAAGMLLGVVLTTYGLYVSSCNTGEGTVSGPTTSSSTPTPVAAAPAPAPTATPALTEPTGSPSFELWGSNDQCIHILYTGEASRAEITTWSTTFDNQDPKDKPDLEKQVIATGKVGDRCWPGKVCFQGDADQPGVKEIGGIFFDKDGRIFVPSRNPEKVVECRTTPCVEVWREQEEHVVEYGEYGECKRGDTQEGCYKSRKVTTIIYETNSCTLVKREKSRVITYGTTPCECPCVEPKETPEIPSTVYWNTAILEGKCNPEVLPLVGIDASTITPSLNCHTTGQQRINLDYQCSADSFRTRDLCKNVACPTPPPTCDNTPASYKGNANNGLFNLQNSGDAAELAWVNSNVLVGPWEKFDDEGEKDDDCTDADVSAKVVIVKAGSSSSIEYSYKTYLNVTAGQQLCSYDPPGSDKAKDISHITYFRCD